MNDEIPEELARLRASIDNLDMALVSIMAERFKITQRVGLLKAQLGLPAADPQREQRQIKRLKDLARSAELDEEFAAKLLNFIIREVVWHHLEIADDQGV